MMRYFAPGSLVDVSVSRTGRKVARFMRPLPGGLKARVLMWHHSKRRWGTRPVTVPCTFIRGLAPADWPQTRAAVA